MKNHIMKDIETLGVKPGCIILSFAAVQFDLDTGETGATFERNISLKSNLKVGLEINPDTFDWWLEKPNDVFRSMLSNTVSIREAFRDYDLWFKSLEFPAGDIRVWAQGPHFDMPIFEKAWEIAVNKGVEVPYKFWMVRDTRTVYELAYGEGKAPMVRSEADYHNALGDCHAQIKCLIEAIERIYSDIKRDVLKNV